MFHQFYFRMHQDFIVSFLVVVEIQIFLLLDIKDIRFSNLGYFRKFLINFYYVVSNHLNQDRVVQTYFYVCILNII